MSQSKKNFWNDRNVDRLLMWYDRMKNKDRPYDRVAKKLKVSKSSAYQKLGRLGKINASWAKQYK